MALFDQRNRTLNRHSRRIYAIYEIIYTLVDFGAASLFLGGSIMFFDESLKTPAIWCFVLGSLLFASKPTLRLIREVHLLANGSEEDVDALAARFGYIPPNDGQQTK